MPSVIFNELRYDLRPGESVLDALIRGGADIAFSCRKGACHVCIMHLVDGELNEEASCALRPELAHAGHFLPCRAHPLTDLVIEPSDLSELTCQAMVHKKEQLSPKVVQLQLEPEINLDWTPGQYINLITDSGLSRSYSIASVAQEDYFITLHVGHVENGAVSTWIHDELKPGDFVRIQGPMGDCVYRPEDAHRPLLLLGTGTGIAPLYAILRDALSRGHQPPIQIFHGASSPEELYLDQELRELARLHNNLTYSPVVSDLTCRGPWQNGWITDLAFDAAFERADHVVYLCGSPDMVYQGRFRAVSAGVARTNIQADPFEDSHPYMPQDSQKLATIAPDPELWQALDQGKLLRQILEEFYTEIYEDPRLSPFFHNSTKERAISKQYEFLASIFCQGHTYFGLNPFNAHHWMIISDELFDYREELFETFLHRYNLDKKYIRRWMGIQELFRREIVKSKERGLIIDGIEQLKTGFSRETLAIGSLCDGCFQEMPANSEGIMHQRTGEFYCLQCNPSPGTS